MHRRYSFVDNNYSMHNEQHIDGCLVLCSIFFDSLGGVEFRENLIEIVRECIENINDSDITIHLIYSPALHRFSRLI